MKGAGKRVAITSLAILLLTVFLGYFFLFAGNTEVFEDERGVFIPRDASLVAVSDSLESSGILADASRFKLVARATGWGDQIKSGFYEFESGASNVRLLDKLRKGLQTPVKVVIPPGLTKHSLARAVARNMEFEPEVFLAAMSDVELARTLGTDTTNLVGYILPDTYNFYWQASPETVIRSIKKTFDDFYADNATDNPAGMNLSAEEVNKVASIVEWETAVEEEKARVAGVYLNRLRDRWLLDADPTIQFAIVEREGQKRRLFFRDYEIDHPYNTYKHPGLPPGPVTNPSRSSILSVINPEVHGYYFFVANIDGTHTFSATLRDHRRAAKKFHEAARLRRQQAAALAE